jgi:REP element-mobilizing transposase RayT
VIRAGGRRSIRLKGFDYGTPGAYFVTICAHNRACVFGEVVDDVVRLNDPGNIVAASWADLPTHYPHVRLDAFVVMPNHVHGILLLTEGGGVGAGFKPAPTRTNRHPLSEVVRGFKSFSARRVNGIRNTPGAPVWQRNYYENIIRSQSSLDRIRRYIIGNPAEWSFDPENPGARAGKPPEGASA